MSSPCLSATTRHTWIGYLPVASLHFCVGAFLYTVIALNNSRSTCRARHTCTGSNARPLTSPHACFILFFLSLIKWPFPTLCFSRAFVMISSVSTSRTCFRNCIVSVRPTRRCWFRQLITSRNRPSSWQYSCSSRSLCSPNVCGMHHCWEVCASLATIFATPSPPCTRTDTSVSHYHIPRPCRAGTHGGRDRQVLGDLVQARNPLDLRRYRLEASGPARFGTGPMVGRHGLATFAVCVL